jgi:hypothetical protein
MYNINMHTPEHESFDSSEEAGSSSPETSPEPILRIDGPHVGETADELLKPKIVRGAVAVPVSRRKDGSVAHLGDTPEVAAHRRDEEKRKKARRSERQKVAEARLNRSPLAEELKEYANALSGGVAYVRDAILSVLRLK